MAVFEASGMGGGGAGRHQEALSALADAPVAALHDRHRGWRDVVVFAACTAARIGEVSGCRVPDMDTTQWMRTERRRTTPASGGPTTTQRYPHPDVHKITAAGAALSAHFNVLRAPHPLTSPSIRAR
ncbi:hypothetical protein [Streptomyces buecherae]|uniref:hypothetical protein n=1 Tax=Streptomyces buecherae TaxID=2763006 RepID=UPI003797F6FA